MIAGMMLGLVGTATAQSAVTPQANSSASSQYPGHYPFTAADVGFITGMISHHSQAILIAGWAPTHGASQTILTLCARIINAQQDEITLMQNWLRDRKQPVPDGKPMAMGMSMPGMEHELMPGMLSDSQLKVLDASHGPQFDRTFLHFMIQHHTGALTMVDKLFATTGAGQDEAIYKLASDVYADQSTEINRMQKLLITLAGE